MNLLMNGVLTLTLVAGQVFDWGGGVQATVFNPPSHPLGSDIDEYDDSPVLLVEHGAVRFLFVADLHHAGEARVLVRSTPTLPPAQVLVDLGIARLLGASSLAQGRPACCSSAGNRTSPDRGEPRSTGEIQRALDHDVLIGYEARREDVA